MSSEDAFSYGVVRLRCMTFQHYRQARLMAIMDAINRIFGRGTLVFAVQGLKHTWRMRQERLSQRYTTYWEELLTIEG